MRIGPKYKIAKRLGAGIFEKTQGQKFQLSQSRSEKSSKRRGARSEYGRQFLEKQKVRYTYGISERQFKNYVNQANAGHSKNPMEKLFEILESRLDNVVYRMGLAPTRRAARQMVSHGHILLNGRKNTVPSAQTKAEDMISIRGGSQTSVLFTNLEERLKDYTSPSWVIFDADKKVGTVKNAPLYKADDRAFDLRPVLEFYSR